jgi:hypothetical protein
MSAAEFNSHQAAAAFVTAQQARRGLPKEPQTFDMDRTRPWVVSGASESIRAFSCVVITGVATTHETTGSDFYSRTPILVGKPTSANKRFLIVQDGLPEADRAARAATDGITPAWVTFTTENETYKTVGPVYDSFDLEPGGTGAEILWKPSGTGSLLCVVRLGYVARPRKATLTAELTAGSSATAISFTEFGTETITVYDNMLKTGDSVASGKGIYVELFADGKWRMTAAPCN